VIRLTILSHRFSYVYRFGKFQPQETHDDYQQVEDFDVFFKELKAEAAKYGLEDELTVDEAREMFESLQDEFSSEMESLEINDKNSRGSEVHRQVPESDPTGRDSVENEPNEGREIEAHQIAIDNSEERTIAVLSEESPSEPIKSDSKDLNTKSFEGELQTSSDWEALEGLDEGQLYRIRKLQASLPGLPISRVKKVAKAFEDTLGYPSLLTLVPLLRETLPDHITLGWLRRINARNADFVLQKAEEEKVVDVSLLNSMLQTKAYASSLSEAESFHRDEFRRHQLVRDQIIHTRPLSTQAAHR